MNNWLQLAQAVRDAHAPGRRLAALEALIAAAQKEAEAVRAALAAAAQAAAKKGDA